MTGGIGDDGAVSPSVTETGELGGSLVSASRRPTSDDELAARDEDS